MDMTAAQPYGLITFLYYADLSQAAKFYEDVMGLALVQDQGMARIYRVGSQAFLGIVDGAKGHFHPQPQSAVLMTLVVDDVAAWHEYLHRRGVAGLSEVTQGTHVTHFFLEDPGGYGLEVQSFLDASVTQSIRA